MAFSQPKVLIFGHSFVRRLHRDLRAQFDIRAFNLHHVSTTLHGVGGRTVQKLIKHDFQFIQRFQPHIIILEIGTNDLSKARPETVGSKIDDLVALLLTVPTVKVFGVCLVTFRASSPEFNEKVTLLNQYLKVVFEDVFNVFCWTHKGFTQPTISGGEAEFWNGEFFFFSPGNTEFFVSYATESGILCAWIGIQNFAISNNVNRTFSRFSRAFWFDLMNKPSI